MDRGDLGRHRPPELDRLHHVAGHLGDGDDHALATGRWPDDRFRPDVDLDPAPLVLAVDEDHRGDQDRDDHDDQPRPERELGDGEDEGHDPRGHGAEAIDDRTAPPSRVPAPKPVADHAGLRQRDRGEHADRVERDQRGHQAAERDQDDDRDRRPARRCRR